ncbi:M23 family metallopeptidase [Streptomyces sp. NPDC058001]|uniref:M23 family metallopeptidase n=1 Tax=Streptomyces sp. NPDC058001 TaxID=3346300 RepID=UPI0036E4E772
MRYYTGVMGATGAVALLLGAAIGPAQADVQAQAGVQAKPKFQMPFACGTNWQLNTYGGRHNPALDIVVKGNTGSDGKKLKASAKGTVAKAFSDRGAGNVVIIKHSGGWYTAYYHLKDKAGVYVKAGTKVKPSTTIGRIGKTGANSGGWAHLHYEQRYRASGIPTESHRKAVDFNGKRYTGVNRQWSSVKSANCP